VDAKVARDIPEEKKKLYFSASDLCLTLRRVIDSRKLYARGHPALMGMVGELNRRLAAHVAEHGALTLFLSSLALLLEGRPVLQAERREDSISHGPYLDGVRTITFERDLGLDDTATLIEVWCASLYGSTDSSQTFPTRLWEAGLRGVRTTSLDTLVEGGDIDAAVAEIRTGRAPLRAGAPASKALVDGVKPIELDIGARLPDQPQRISLQEIGAEDLKRLASTVPMERRDGAWRTTVGLAALAPLAGEGELPKLQKAVQSLFGSIVRDGSLQEAADLAHELGEAARAEDAPPGRREYLPGMLEALDSPEILGVALSALQEPERADAAVALLREMPTRAAEPLLEELAQPHDPHMRRRLVSVIIELAPTREMLEKRVTSAEPSMVLDVLEVARALAPADAAAVRLTALKHASGAVRKAALDSFGAANVAENAAVLRPLVRDPEPAVGRAALDLLVRARDPEAAGMIGEVLARRGTDPDEQRRLLMALGTLGGDVACLLLRRRFRSERAADLRAACALALAQAGDEYSRPLLESTSRRWFVSRTVKDACREALRRLERRRTGRAAAEGA